METKSDKVRNLVQSGQYKEALAIVKTFKLGFNRDEKSLLARAHEAQWNPDFYTRLGFNPEALFKEAVDLLVRHYGA